MWLFIFAALAGLSLTFAVETLGSGQYIARSVSQVETLMTSVERVSEYTELDPEPGYDVQEVPPSGWPPQGSLELKDVGLSYSEGGNSVLEELTLTIEAEDKVGVVGRTGAGKSSIIAALTRMPAPRGKVLIDGLDLSTLNLQAARKAITVISQEPVLFSGSLRDNLDPLKQCTDASLWSALEHVGMKPLVQQLPGQLQCPVTKSGQNFSAGQRQLLCLARALTREARVLILDEPTASVDFQTEETIQEVIQQHFKHCTVLNIAHRLETVMTCDKVLVMDQGRVAEFDEPAVLVGKPGGLFNQMAKAYRQTMECERAFKANHGLAA